MGEASEPDDPGHGSSADHGHDEEEHHGPSIGVVTTLNVVINAVINAGFGYGIAWLHWQDYTLAWYTHHLHSVFETDFVAEDVIVQGLSVGIIVTLIVAAILHRQWDAGDLQPGRYEQFLIQEERTRGRHMAVWAGMMGFMGAAVGVGISAFTLYGGVDEISGATFALARTVNGFVVGGLAGGFVTASWVTNLTEGKLVPSEGGRTVVARTMARASRHPWAVIGVVVLLTAGLGAGVTELNTNVDETDAMPRGTGDHEAAVEAAESFNGTHRYGFELHFRTDPTQCRADNDRNLPARSSGDVDCANISDEVYVRAMDEVYTFLESYSYEPEDEALQEDVDRVDSPVEGQLGLPSYHKLANWTLAGGMNQAPEEAYGLPAPQDRARVNAAERVAWDRLGEAQSATIGAEAGQATVRYHVDPEAELTSSQFGAFAVDARDAYLDWADNQGDWQVFTDDNAPLVTVDRPVANAHHAETLGDDLPEALAFLGAGLFVGLAVVLRDPLAALVATTMVAIAGAWTFGTMGAAEVPLSELDLAQAPLIVAAGVLFSVPVIESFLNHLGEDRDTEEALHEAGDEAGFPIYMGTLVAMLGLTAIGLGPSALLADAAWVSMLALASTLLLSITFLPAAMSLIGSTGRLLEGGVSGPGSLSADGGAPRAIAAVLLAGITLASFAGVAGIEEGGWTQPVDTWPDDDERRDEHRQAVLGFHELPSGAQGYEENALVVRGDPTDPATLSYLETLSSELEGQASDNELLVARTSRDLPAAIEDWLEVCCGASSLAGTTLAGAAGDQGAQQTDPYPQSREEIEQTLEEMYGSPYADVARPLLPGPTGSTMVQTFEVRSGDAQTVDEAWASVQGAVEAASGEEPEDVETAVVGPSATSYLVNEEQLDWLFYMLAASIGTAALFGLGYTRSLRDTLALTLAVGLASLWLLALLNVMDVALSMSVVLGLTVVTLASGLFGTRLIWPREGEAAAGTASGRPGLFSVLVLGTLFAGLGTVVEASAGFPSTLAQDAILSAVAGLGAAYLAAALVGRALLPSREPETDEAKVVEAAEEPSSPA